MLCLYLQAPFAACRAFAAGWYRPTSTFLTPSAAYGLILNIAGIDSRLYEHDPNHNGSAPASLKLPELPETRLAIGAPASDSLAASLPTVQTIYQHLHNYPVGRDAGMPAEVTKGNKNNITPVRREFLCNLRTYVCVDGNEILEGRIRRGLNGEFNSVRYGVPFLGDNQFLLDRLEIVSEDRLRNAYWYEAVTNSTDGQPRLHSTRLTITVDRANMSRTASRLFAPITVPTRVPSNAAWVEVGRGVCTG